MALSGKPPCQGASWVLGGLALVLVSLLVFEESPSPLPVLALLTIVAAGACNLRGATAAAAQLDRSRKTEATLRERAQATLARQRAADQARGASEAQLRVAKESAEAIARSRSEFLANMTHEIRTPLNGIMGMAELALETRLTAEQREYLTAVRASAQCLLAIVDDVLDFSEIERGTVRLDSAPFALDAVLESALAPLRARAATKSLAVTVESHAAVPANFVGDGRRLGQVLAHLVCNAVKFTDHGSVTVRVGVLQRNDTQATLLFAVEDTGVGILADKQALVFEAFTQADGSSTRKHGGTGLGLALSRELVGLLGGRLWLESQPGRGSVFFFTARMEIGEALREAAPVRLGVALERAVTSRPPEALDVLLAEDTEVNQELVLQILTRRGHRVLVVADGKEAVRACASESFDVVLMDVQMPVLDGIEATRRIRAAEAPGAHVPILALTARSEAGDEAGFRKAGMDGYLAKPFRIEELVSAVESAVPRAARSARSIDRADFLERVGGDANLFREIAATFCADLPRQIRAVASAIGERNGERVERAAHSLKGACAVVGAHEAARLAGVLEDAGAADAVDDADSTLAALQTELASAVAALGDASPEALEAR